MPKARLLPASYSISRRWTEDDARVVIAAQAASGLSVAAFAAREGIDPQRLYCQRSPVWTHSRSAKRIHVRGGRVGRQSGSAARGVGIGQADPLCATAGSS